MCRCDPGTQCWVHWVNVKAAHFGARMLKRRPPGGGACQTGLKSDRVTIWQVNKTCRRQLGHLTSCWWWQSSLHLLVRNADRQCSHPQLVSPDHWSQRMQPSLAFMSRLSSMSFVYSSKCRPVSHLHVSHQIFTPTCFSTVFQVSSCLTHLLKARTVHFKGCLLRMAVVISAPWSHSWSRSKSWIC